MSSFGVKPNDSEKIIDYRWSDPQNHNEAATFLAKRILLSVEKNNLISVALVGPNLLFAEKVKQILESTCSVTLFPKVSEFVDFLNHNDQKFIIGVSSFFVKEIHEITQRFVDCDQLNSMPFEYAVVPKMENVCIDKMWENSNDFISPLHKDDFNWLELFENSCELFDPKTGIRDYMDLIQGLRHVTQKNVVGDIAEFGSFKGQSGYLTASYLQGIKSEKSLYMFDMFESFPDESVGVDKFWSQTHEVDYFDIKKKFKKFSNVNLVKGDFTKTFETSTCGNLALVFVDCDSFRGTKYIIEKIFEDFLSKGGVMIFEDYGHASLAGNRLAVHQGFDNKENAFCFFSHFSGSYFVTKTS